MALAREDATRIVRFCLAGDGWGTATYDGDRHVLKLVLTGTAEAEARRFEGASFEEVLADAVSAGILKATCVSKQIAFLAGGSSTPVEAARDPPSFPEITATISALIHETQRERGISSLYTASGGNRFGKELGAQWRATDRRYKELIVSRKHLGDTLPSPVAERLARAEELLDGIAASRHRVESLETLPTELIESYSRANAELLGVIDVVLSRMVDPPQRPTALAWMALLHAKEKTGIERAQLASAFERDRYFDGQYQAVLGLIAARQSYLHLFAAAAPVSAEALMRARLESEVGSTVEQMEGIALSHREGGFGVDAAAWFTTISRHIDLLADVEATVRVSLTRWQP